MKHEHLLFIYFIKILEITTFEKKPCKINVKLSFIVKCILRKYLRYIKKKFGIKKIRSKKGHLYIHDLYIIFVKRITNFYLITSV